jgi:hypothetical protein
MNRIRGRTTGKRLDALLLPPPLRLPLVLLLAAGTGCVSRIDEVDCAKEPTRCPELVQRAPRLHVDPPFGLGFDCVELGCEQSRELVIANKGGGIIELTMVRPTLDTSQDFFVTLLERSPDGTEHELPAPRRPESVTAAGVGPLELREERTVVVRVRYVPSDAEADRGAVLIEYHDGLRRDDESPYQRVQMPLHTRVMGQARATVLASEINFGHVPVNEQKTVHIVLQNVSQGNSILEVNAAEVTEAAGTDADGETGASTNVPSAFSLGFGWSPLANAGEVIEVPVHFVPEREGAFWGTVVLRTNDPEQAETRVQLRGLSADGARLAIIEPAHGGLDFGVVRYGQTRRRSVTVRNHGASTVDITVQVQAGVDGEFRVAESGTGLPRLGPFDETVVWIEYRAVSAGPATGTLHILTDDAAYGPPVQRPLEAFCSAPELALSATLLDLGTVVQGWVGETKTLSVSNQGTGELTVADVALEFGSSSQVRLPALPPLPAMLSPDDPPLQVPLYLQASALGPIAATLVVHTDGIVEPVRRVRLGGQVVTCEQGCAFANGSPDCSAGLCALQACDSGWHDTDEELENGCECREERFGKDIGGTCDGGLDLGTVGDACAGKPSTIERTGTLHSRHDVDLYFVRSHDAIAAGCDVFSDSSETEVSLTGAPAGLVLCARIRAKGTGCGGYSHVFDTLYCGAREYRHGGSYGRNDNRDMTAWVMWHPDASPVCDSYKLRFSGRK